MDGPASTRCEYEHWWTKRRLQTSNEYPEQDSISLPPPSFPPALNFDPEQYLLPPSYEEAIDLEKALHSISPARTTSSNVLYLRHAPTSPEPLLSKTRITQQPTVVRPRKCIRIIRHLRYTIFTVYRRLFTFVFLLNTIGAYFLTRQHFKNKLQTINLDTLATLASSNFLLAILVRQDFLVNLLFRTAWLVPWNVPLRLRRMVARVYCYGGLHSGAAVAGTLWWVVFTVGLSWTFMKKGVYAFPVVVITWVVLVILVMILLLAVPQLRAKHHDTFEMTHRFLGWTSIALFWAQLLLLTHHHVSTSSESLAQILLHTPTFWNLTAMTAFLVYPWLHLRRWTFTAHTLSSHALQLSFHNPVHKFSCLSISSSPLREWHPFATFPSTDPASPDTSMVISDAGDWTRNIIRSAHIKPTLQQTTSLSNNTTIRSKSDENQLKLRFWIKSHPKAGVLSLSCLFPRVLIVTTGSGIGPSLSSLLDRPARQFARLIWSTRSPLHTYGAKMLDLVHQADPEALIIDTSEMGRPDLLDVAWRMYQEVRAEAVFVLSNEGVTRMVVGGLERRGVPAFGPIWDS